MCHIVMESAHRRSCVLTPVMNEEEDPLPLGASLVTKLEQSQADNDISINVGKVICNVACNWFLIGRHRQWIENFRVVVDREPAE